jgi:hypothetical protein
MTDQNKRWQEWEKVRMKGSRHFIWFNGVLIFGLGSAALFSVVVVGFNFLSPSIIPIAFLIFPISGYFWGLIVWRLSESGFAKRRGLPPGNESLKRPPR